MRPTVDVSLLTTGHDVADARLHRLTAVLLAHGMTVEVHGLGRPDDGPPGVPVTTSRRRGLLRRAGRAAVLPWRARGRVLVVLDPDLVVPALIRRTLGAAAPGTAPRVVVDVHEDYRLALRDRPWAQGPALWLARVVVSSASGAATRADLTVVADDHLPPARPRHRLVVRNLPLAEMLPPPTEPGTSPRALYVGDVRRSRGLHSMLSVLEQAPAWTLDVVGPVAARDRQWLARWQATSPARHRVRFHGRRPPREAWRIAQGAWVGLCLLDPTPAFWSALPTKLVEYLACGLAVVTSPLPRAVALLAETSAGTVVSHPADAAAALRRWSDSPTTVDAPRAAARAWAEEALPRCDDYARFVRLVAELAGPGPR